jgi:hypothetical protein
VTTGYTTEELAVSRRGDTATLRDADGTDWRVEVRLPGASNAMVVFHHPTQSRLNRYAWHIWRGPEARSVTARVPKAKVRDSLDEASIGMLFRRSMPIAAERSLVNLGVGAQDREGWRN